MGRCCAACISLSLAGALAGCQSLSREGLAAKSNAVDAGAPIKGELSVKAAATVCRATGELMEKDGKEIEAIAYYEKADQGGDPKAARRLAVLYDEQKDYHRAMVLYKQLLQKSPRDAELLMDVGYCYYNQGNWAEAEKHLRQAVALNPKLARAWINLGMTLAQSYRTAESLEAFGKVVSPAQAQSNLAFILTTQGRYEDAKAYYRKALAGEPDLMVARLALEKLEKAGRPATPALATGGSPRVDAVASERFEEPASVQAPLP
jgi:tetratricopeptide (TPR) repeat protein